MLQHVSDKLREAELKLELRFPKKLFDFIRKLEEPEVAFGEEVWNFPTVTDTADENFIISRSEWFKEHWSRKALVIAVNEYDDYLLVLQSKDGKILKQLFVLVGATSEIKIFNTSLENLLEHGPFDYLGWDDFYLKLEHGKVIQGDEID